MQYVLESSTPTSKDVQNSENAASQRLTACKRQRQQLTTTDRPLGETAQVRIAIPVDDCFSAVFWRSTTNSGNSYFDECQRRARREDGGQDHTGDNLAGEHANPYHAFLVGNVDITPPNRPQDTPRLAMPTPAPFDCQSPTAQVQERDFGVTSCHVLSHPPSPRIEGKSCSLSPRNALHEFVQKHSNAFRVGMRDSATWGSMRTSTTKHSTGPPSRASQHKSTNGIPPPQSLIYEQDRATHLISPSGCGLIPASKREIECSSRYCALDVPNVDRRFR